MTTYSTVDCCEEAGTYSEQWGEDEISAQVTLRCTWANKANLIADILGNQKAHPIVSGARAQSASAVPDVTKFTQNSQGITWIDALVTFNYSSDQEENLIDETLEPTVEFLTHDHKRFRWGSLTGDPLLEAEAPATQFKGLNLVRTYHRQSSIPSMVIDTAVGSVNDADYTSSLLGLTFNEEGLLFQPPTLSRSITTAGSKGWKIVLKFSYKPQGWNKFFRAKSNDWEEIVDAETGAVFKPYPPEDFSTLLS